MRPIINKMLRVKTRATPFFFFLGSGRMFFIKFFDFRALT
jgi:hypothetical protein